MSSRGCCTAGDQLDPSSPLSSRNIAASFLVPKKDNTAARQELPEDMQGPSVLQTEEPAAGKAHLGEAAEGWIPLPPKGGICFRVPSHPAPVHRYSTSQAPMLAGLPAQGTMAWVWVYPSIRL